MDPQQFGKYLLLDRVAAGGMAEVWRAKFSGVGDFHRIVAIKKILDHVAQDNDFVTMFKDEAKTTVLLQHANIGQVHELGKVEDTYFIAMEYVSGKDSKKIWKHQRRRKEPLPVEIACYIMQNAAEGLDYAHRKKDNYGGDLEIVHRDVSPQNILLSWEGEVKVIDFGIAKAISNTTRTLPGILKGKFGYMSPEQVRGLPLDHRSDVFSLGVCLYELVTGSRAFCAEADHAVLEIVRNVELVPPSSINKQIPVDLERIIYRALAKEPDDRYQWASEFSQALQIFLRERGAPPTRMDVGKYLRENFADDHDRERLRLELFRQIEEPDSGQDEVSDHGDGTVVFAETVYDGVGLEDVGLEDENATVISGPEHYNVDDTVTKTMPPEVVVEDSSLAVDKVDSAVIRPSLKPWTDAAPPEEADNSAEHSKGKPRFTTARYLSITIAALVVLNAMGLVGYHFYGGRGTILITSLHEGATIFLDGVNEGQIKGGGLAISNVRAGVHDIAAQKADHFPYSGKVHVEKKSTTTHTIHLEKLRDKLGQVDVKADPKDNGDQTPF